MCEYVCLTNKPSEMKICTREGNKIRVSLHLPITNRLWSIKRWWLRVKMSMKFTRNTFLLDHITPMTCLFSLSFWYLVVGANNPQYNSLFLSLSFFCNACLIFTLYKLVHSFLSCLLTKYSIFILFSMIFLIKLREEKKFVRK